MADALCSLGTLGVAACVFISMSAVHDRQICAQPLVSPADIRAAEQAFQDLCAEQRRRMAARDATLTAAEWGRANAFVDALDDGLTRDGADAPRAVEPDERVAPRDLAE